MCTIAINPASVSAIPVGNGMQVTVSGTVNNCVSQNVWVMIECGGRPPIRGQAVITGSTWTITLISQCPCGTQITITAVCNGTPSCQDVYTTTLTCNCCPTISTEPPCFEYDSSGHALVRFKTHVNVPGGCAAVTVLRDFGDGSFGQSQTYGANTSNIYSEVHAYVAGYVYHSTVNVTSPALSPPCPSSQISIQTSQPPPCAQNYWLGVFCMIAQMAFLIFAGTAIVMTFMEIFGCGAFVTNSMLGGFVLLAIVAFLFIWFACAQCACDFARKLLGQLLLVCGILFSMLIVPSACIGLLFIPNVTNAKETAFFIGLTVLLLFFGWLVLHLLWQGQGCCPVTICAVWQAIIVAMASAVAACLLVFIMTNPAVQPWGFVTGCLLAGFITNIAHNQIIINQNAHNC
jgi:hypothetical protein